MITSNLTQNVLGSYLGWLPVEAFKATEPPTSGQNS